MRLSRTFIVAPLAVAIAAGCGSDKPATQFTVGMTSQISVPRDVQSVRVTAFAGGNRGFCETYPVVDGKARLPQSLALAPGDASSSQDQVTVSVVAFSVSKDRVDQEQSFVDQCDVPTVSPSDNASEDASGDGNKGVVVQGRILRRSRQSYTDNKNLYVPMPLRYSCYGVNCTSDQTCKGGLCVPPDTDNTTLPAYDDSLLFGNSSSCFDPNICLDDAVGPNVIDASQCIYEVPKDRSFVQNGINVRVIYDGYRVEILDLDPVEGFTRPDKSNPYRFQLAPGLCSSGLGPKIKSIVASTTCTTKNVYQPICSSSANITDLAPSPSALILVFDDDTTMVDYVGTKNSASTSTDKTSALDDVLGIALGDPVFITSELAFRFVPTAGSECTDTTYGTPDKTVFGGPTFAEVGAGISQLTSYIGQTLTKPTTGLALNAFFGQMNGVFGVQVPPKDTLGHVIAYNKKAIVLATNRSLDTTLASNCSGSASAGVQAAATNGFDTYVFSLRNALETPAQTQARIDAGKAFGVASGARVFGAEGGAAADETSSKLAAASGVSEVVTSLGSCLYDKPSNFTDATKGTLILRPTGLGPPGSLASDPTCTSSAAQSTANGWGFDKDGVHIRVCGGACTLIRSYITQNQLYTAQRNQMGNKALPGQIMVQLQLQ